MTVRLHDVGMQLNDIRTLLGAITAGKWSREVYEDGENGEGPYGVHPGCPGPMVESRDLVVYNEDGSITRIADVDREGDAAFLVRAPDAVRLLLAVVDALPRCDNCEQPATTKSTASGALIARGVPRCDACAAKWPTTRPADLPYADALRALAASR